MGSSPIFKGIVAIGFGIFFLIIYFIIATKDSWLFPLNFFAKDSVNDLRFIDLWGFHPPDIVGLLGYLFLIIGILYLAGVDFS